MVFQLPDFIKPEFFDVFGLPIFAIILIISIFQLTNKKKLPNWVWWLLIVFAILGLLVDGVIISILITIKQSVFGG